MQPGLAVPDVDETVAFYGQELGLHAELVHGDLVRFSAEVPAA